MDLRGLQVFLEVAELKSFTRAGQKLGYSQPTVSFQIRQLEQELGVPLFDRIGHTVSLTDAGREALSYAQRIWNLSREMTLCARPDSEIRGTIRLGMADSLCYPLIARDFGRFRQKYPGIDLHIYDAGTGDLFRMLDHNEVDLLCTMDSRVFDAAYITAEEEAVDTHFIVSSRHLLARQQEVSLEQLMDYPFLLTERNMSYRRLMDEKLAANSMEVRPVLETARADLICDLVGQNMGISFLPDYVTEEAAQQGVITRLEIPDFGIRVWKQILYRRDKWLSPPMKAMIDHLSGIHLQPAGSKAAGNNQHLLRESFSGQEENAVQME